MNKLKRTLALALVLCMLCSFFHVSAFAAEASAPATNLNTSGSPFQKGTGESNSFRIPALVTLSDGTLVAAADARWNTTYDGGGLDTMVAISKDNGATWTHSFANYLGDNGNEYNGSSSSCFIDPALTVVSTDTNNDGVNEDTIYMLVDLYPYGVALNGKGNTAPNTDTGFTDDGYLKLDYNSAGTYGYYLKDGEIYANGSSTPLNGYTVDAHFNVTNENTNPATTTNLFYADSIFKVARTGFLYLTKSTDKGATWSAPQLLNLKNAGEQVCLVGPGRGTVVYNDKTPYIVFPVYSYNSGTQRVGFIYSADGTNWERSANLNYNWGSESAVVDLNNNSMRFFFRNGSGKLMYVDYTWNGGWGTPQTTNIATNSNTQISAISLQKTIDDQQVILVSCPTGPNGNGSTSSSGSARVNGKIFLFTVNGDTGELSKRGEVSLTSKHSSTNYFMYSCLSALTDEYGNETGDIAILYEDNENNYGTSSTSYYEMSFETVKITDFGVTTDEDSNVDIDTDTSGETYEEDVIVKLGETFSETVKGIYVPSDSKEDDYVSVSWVGTEATTTKGIRRSDSAVVDLTDCLFTFTDHETEGFYVVESSAFASRYLNNTMLDTSATEPISATPGKLSLTLGHTDMFRLQSNNVEGSTYGSPYYAGLHFHTELSDPYWNRCGDDTSEKCHEYLYRAAKAGETSSTEIPGYIRLKSLDDVQSGGEYLIAHTNGTNYYVLYPGESQWECVVKVDPTTNTTPASTTVTITPKKAGQTTVELGNGAISYEVTVTPDNIANIVDVKNLKVDESRQFTESSGAYTTATVAPDANVVRMELVTNTAEATIEIGEAVNPVTAGKYVIYTYLGAYVTNKADGNYIDLSTTEQTVWNVAVADSNAGTYYITDSDGNYLTVGSGTAGVTSTQTAVKLVHGTSTDDPGQSGFFIQNAGGNYNLNNSGGTDNAYGKSGANGSWSRWQFKPCTETPGTASTTVTFTGVASGSTTAVVGNTQYNISVASKYDAEIDVTLMVGESKTLVNDTGVYEDVDDSKLNTSIATVEITGSNTTTEKNLSDNVTAIESGKTYVLYNKSASKLMNNQWANAAVGGGGTNGLALSSSKDGFQDNDCWTITVTDGGYYVQDINGKYLTIARGSAGVSDSPVVASLAYDGTDWTIGVNGEYANNYGEAGSAVAGWNDINDRCSQWEIYEVVSTVTSASTEITFTGVASGTTTAVVGNTLYNITVTPASGEPFEKEENVMLLVGQSKTHTDPTGNYEASYTGEGLDENIATVTVKGTNVEGSTTVTPVTTLTTDDTFYIQVSEGVYRTANGGTTTNLAEAELWTVKEGGGSYGRLMNEAGDYLIVDNGALTSQTAGNTYFNFDGYTYEIYYQTATVNITVGVPLKINVTEAKDVTDITFTGNSEGTTSVIVGKTRYNITVVSAYDCVTSENSPFVVGGDFIGSVTNDAKNEGMDYLTKLTMSSVMTKENLGGGSGVGYQVDLSSKFADAESISWSIADENIARIEVGADGKSVYVTAADANTTGTTYLSCTIDGQTYTIPVVIIKTTDVTSNSNWKYNSLHIAEITRTDVWYSWNCSGNKNQFVKAVEGEAIWTVFNKAEKFCINFYAAPDARHALTFMSATNSEGQYLTLADKNNPKNCDFYTKDGAGYRERKNNGFTDDQVANDIQAALDLGCDGAQGFSRSNTDPNAVNCNLTFISDPMPELAKTVNGILPITRLQKDFRRYYDGMVATVGEYVYFELTVTLGRPDVWKPVTDANGNAVKDDAGNVIISTDENGNPYGSIAYDTADLIDTALEGAYFYTKEDDRADEDNPDVLDGVISTESRQVQVQDITDALNAAWAADETVRTLSYYVIYEIQSEDIPKFLIENTATLEWDYDSHYSSGALDADAAADATITVVGTPMDNVVIDFGQKVVYTGLTYTHLKYVNLGTFDSAYGTYTVEGVGAVQDDGIGNKYYNEYKITYTPEAILQSPDTIQLMGTYTDVETNKEITKVINGFVVYPATTVYYEEGFLLDNNNGWNDDSAKVATTEQTFELLGLSQYTDNGLFTGFVSDQKHNYGFDPIYDGVGNDDVAASSISANTVGASTEFTFTGTGFELFADCTEDSGYIQVIVNDAAGKTVKMFMVNTVVKGGSTGATSGQTGRMEDLPIVSLKDLEHGSYTVKLIKVMNDNKTVTIDGVRITNTYDNSIVYAIDNEETPAFYQLRDYVISAIGIDAETVEDYSDLTGMAQQVYNDLISKPNVDSNAPTALITDVNTLYGNSSTIQDLLVNGPKNELYLWEGQTLTFKLYTARIMQIGMKAPNGETNYTITITPESGSETTNNGSIASTVDMFYTLNNDPAAPQEYLVSITNEGNDATEENEILSITDLKLAYDPSATVQPLTLADVTTVLRAAGYHTNSIPETPVKPAVPFADVVVDDFYYDAVAWAVSEGITTGISDTHFGPLVFCNRAQAVTFLWRAAGSPEPTGTKHQFVDVPAGSFYEKAVLWALENGITTGTDSSHFSPMLSCNRATVVTFLYRAFHSPAVGSTENPFSDVPADDWFTAPILWAVEQEITTGLGDGTFGVTDICNRAQIVTFLYRAYN